MRLIFYTSPFTVQEYSYLAYLSSSRTSPGIQLVSKSSQYQSFYYVIIIASLHLFLNTRVAPHLAWTFLDTRKTNEQIKNIDYKNWYQYLLLSWWWMPVETFCQLLLPTFTEIKCSTTLKYLFTYKY